MLLSNWLGGLVRQVRSEQRSRRIRKQVRERKFSRSNRFGAIEQLEDRTLLTPWFTGVSWPSAVDEGGFAPGQVSVDGYVHDDGSESITVQIDWGDGSSPASTSVAPGGFFAFGHAYADDNPTGTPSDQYTITLTAEDTELNSTTSASSVTVDNVDPTLMTSWPSTASVNQTVTVSGTIDDAGWSDTLSLTIDWGDGTTEPLTGLSPGDPYSFTHQYTGTGTYSLSLSATDDDGGTATDGYTLSVSGGTGTSDTTAPTFSSVSVTPSVIDEGDSVSLSGTVNDDSTGSVNVHVAWGDGNSDSTSVSAGGTFNFSYQYVDDDPTGTSSDQYTITLTAEDAALNSATTATSVTVDNLDPTLSTTWPSGSAAVGETVTVSGTVTDPGDSDTLSVTIDWGDGATEPLTGLSPGDTYSFTHQYTGTGSYSLSLSATDDDGGTATDGYTLSVGPGTTDTTAPTFTGVSVSPSVIDEGDSVSLSGTVNDDSTGSVNVHVAWGDGNSDSTSVSAGGTFNFSYQYVDDDPTGTSSDQYTITLTAEDAALNSATTATSVTVDNLDPTLSTTWPSGSAAVGETVTVSGTVTDPGDSDTLSVTIDWGDGATEPLTGLSPGDTYSFTHQYTGTGSYSLSLSAADDDGGTATDGYTLSVGPGTIDTTAPTFTGVSVSPSVIDEGDSVSLSGTVNDDGAGAISLHVAWGDGTSDSATVAPGATFSFPHQYVDDDPSGTSSDAYVITLTATDLGLNTGTTASSVTVNNLDPTLTPPWPSDTSTVQLGTTLTVLGTVDDAGAADNLTVSIDWGDSSTASVTGLSPGDNYTFTHAYSSTSSYTLTLTAADDDGGSHTDSYVLNANGGTAVNQPPTITNNPGNGTYGERDDIYFDMEATNPDGPGIIWTASGLPPGLGINFITGEISGKIAYNAVVGAVSQVYNVTITATDAPGSSGTTTFTWTIQDARIQGIKAQEVDGATLFSNQLTVGTITSNTLYVAQGHDVKLAHTTAINNGGVSPPLDEIVVKIIAALPGASIAPDATFTVPPTITPSTTATTVVRVGIDVNGNGVLDGTETASHQFVISHDLGSFGADIAAQRISNPIESTAYSILPNEHFEVGGTFQFLLSGTNLGGGSEDDVRYQLISTDETPDSVRGQGAGTSFPFTFGNNEDTGPDFVRFYIDANGNDDYDSGEVKLDSQIFHVVPRKTYTVTTEFSSKLFPGGTTVVGADSVTTEIVGVMPGLPFAGYFEVSGDWSTWVQMNAPASVTVSDSGANNGSYQVFTAQYNSVGDKSKLYVGSIINAGPSGGTISFPGIGTAQGGFLDDLFEKAENLLIRKDSANDYRAAVRLIVSSSGTFQATNPGGARPDPVGQADSERQKHGDSPRDIVFVKELTNETLGATGADWHEIILEASESIALPQILAHEFGHGVGIAQSNEHTNVETGAEYESPLLMTPEADIGNDELTRTDARKFDDGP